MPGMNVQQLYGGTQSALSRTLLLWRSNVGVYGAPLVEEQHSRPVLSFIARGERVAVAKRTAASASTRQRGE
jgi:hypothetical protein